MELTRRFIFRGNAVAIGGRIVRPVDRIIESTAASSLPVVGGRSQARASGSGDDFVRYGSAATFAEGIFDDLKQAIEVSYGRLPEDALTATTTATADITDVVIGKRPQLVVKRLHAAMRSKSPAASGEPSVSPLDAVAIDGVSVDNHRLIVELNLVPFQRFDTYSKLMAAVDDRDFVRQHGECLFLTSTVEGRPTASRGSVYAGRHYIYATIVRSPRWDGAAYPGSTIERNVVTIPEFGRIFFGELLLNSESRRLTMMRLRLGSPDGGDVACAEVEDDGSWSLP